MLYTISGVAGVALIVVFGAYHFGVFQRRSPYTDHTIAGTTKISMEWVEITPDKPLLPEGDDQEVVLYLAEPFFHDLLGPGGVKMPDGSTIMPEVQLVDTEGNAFILKFSGSRGRKLICFTLWKQLKGREYRSIRIRAEKNFECKEILWTTIEWKYLS